jgi:hypothetical protein
MSARNRPVGRKSWMQTKGWQRSRELQRLVLDEGLITDQVARAWRVAPSYVRDLARDFNLIMGKGRHKRMAFFTPLRRFETVRDLAASAGVSPATMIDRIVSTVVDEGIEAAKRRLGRQAMPDSLTPHPEPIPTTGRTTGAPAST